MREELKARLRIRVGSLARLALKHNYDRTAISVALQRPWPAVERIIAKALGVEPWELWPERYTKDGRPRGPIRSVRRATDSKARRGRGRAAR